jgi:hypothetical protein
LWRRAGIFFIKRAAVDVAVSHTYISVIF